jgi:hypothetical protein
MIILYQVFAYKQDGRTLDGNLVFGGGNSL